MATRMNGLWQCDGDGWPATCRTLAIAVPPIRLNNQTYVDSLGRSRREIGTIAGGGRQKRVGVDAIEWRSLHLHSINSKPTFQPHQCRERTRTSQDAKVDLKPLIVAIISIYCLSETINLFFFLFLSVFNKLIIFSAN